MLASLDLYALSLDGAVIGALTWVCTRLSLGAIFTTQRLIEAYQLECLTRRFEVGVTWAIVRNFNQHSKHPWMVQRYIKTVTEKEGGQ